MLIEKFKIINYILKSINYEKSPKGIPYKLISVFKYDKTYTSQTLDVLEYYKQITKEFSKI